MATANTTVQYRGIPGHPGYRVGDDGSVWSCWKQVGKGYRYGFDRVQAADWHRLKARANPKGWYVVYVGRWSTVHRLVLLAFVGPCPPGMEACHDPDPNPANNALPNLRWDTHRNNLKDRDRHGRTSRGERHGSARLTEEQVRAIRREYIGRYGQLSSLGRQYGVTPQSIDAIVARRTWRHVA